MGTLECIVAGVALILAALFVASAVLAGWSLGLSSPPEPGPPARRYTLRYVGGVFDGGELDLPERPGVSIIGACRYEPSEPDDDGCVRMTFAGYVGDCRWIGG